MKTIKIILFLFSSIIIVNSCSEDFLKNQDIVKEINIPPLSEAGINQVITLPLDSVRLNGSQSSDKDGKINLWKWSKKSGPPQYMLATPTDSITDVKDLIEGEYVFTLTIVDDDDATSIDSVQVTVAKAVVQSPIISSFTPLSGQVGTKVTITGKNFNSPTVSFNGTKATITSFTTTSISTSVPIGATTGKITVTSNNKTVSSSSNFTVTLPQPTITSFTPINGLIGTTVTITGTNFNSPIVSFNGITSTITSSNATSITTTVPTNATTGQISIVSNGYTIYSTNVFTVNTPTPTGDTYFQGDMTGVTVTRSGSGYKLNGWSNLYSQVNDIYLNNLATSDTYAYQQMVPDPAGSGRTVMMGRILDSDPSQPATSRAQMTISYKSTMNLPVYHSSHRMYIHPDLKYMEQYPGVADWFSLVEIWTAQDPNMDGDPAGSARWGLSLHKSSATGSPLFWHLYGEYMQPASKKYQDFWAYDNKTFAVPFGKWFTLDIYLKRGTGTAGQFKITVTPDGGTTTTVFDVSGDTQYPNRPDLYLDDWQPFKLYIGDTWMDWMRGNGKYMAIYYNDYKWYKN